MQCRKIPVVSCEEFERLARGNPNLVQDNPWIVEGYIERWPKYRHWQDVNYLRERFGHLKAFAKAPNFVTNRKSSLVSVETDFSQYIDYILSPARIGEIYEGRWLEGDYEQYLAQGLPLYCGTLRIVHGADDPVFSEVDPLVPQALRTYNHALPYYYSLFNHFWLLVSLPGALTPLHTDNNATIALIAQLKGRKRAILYSPADLAHVYRADVGFLDPLLPDEDDFPSWQQATRWDGDIEPGQTLFVGTNWAHHVRTLETSISVSFDFVDQSNLAAYAQSAGWATVLGDRIKRKPTLMTEKLQGTMSLPQIQAMPSVALGRLAMVSILRSAMDLPQNEETALIRSRYLRHLNDCMVREAALVA